MCIGASSSCEKAWERTSFLTFQRPVREQAGQCEAALHAVTSLGERQRAFTRCNNVDCHSFATKQPPVMWVIHFDFPLKSWTELVASAEILFM